MQRLETIPRRWSDGIKMRQRRSKMPGDHFVTKTFETETTLLRTYLLSHRWRIEIRGGGGS